MVLEGRVSTVQYYISFGPEPCTVFHRTSRDCLTRQRQYENDRTLKAQWVKTRKARTAAIYILVQLYTYAIWIYCFYPANSNSYSSHVKRSSSIRRTYILQYVVESRGAYQFKYPNRWKIAASSTTDDSFGRAQWVCLKQ